jgi:hypothetical protein
MAYGGGGHLAKLTFPCNSFLSIVNSVCASSIDATPLSTDSSIACASQAPQTSIETSISLLNENICSPYFSSTSRSLFSEEWGGRDWLER